MSDYATDNTVSEENLCTQCGANMKFSPCCGRVATLTRELAEARSQRDGLAKILKERHLGEDGYCIECGGEVLWDKTTNHYNGCRLKAALDAAKGEA